MASSNEMCMLAAAYVAEGACEGRPCGTTILAGMRALGMAPSWGSLSQTLDRLDATGFLKTWRSEPIPIRGGSPRRLITVTPAGERVLLDWLAGVGKLLAAVEGKQKATDSQGEQNV